MKHNTIKQSLKYYYMVNQHTFGVWEEIGSDEVSEVAKRIKGIRIRKEELSLIESWE